jgi:hypothetical protein
MSEPVIDTLEAVEIEAKRGEFCALRLRLRVRTCEQFREKLEIKGDWEDR